MPYSQIFTFYFPNHSVYFQPTWNQEAQLLPLLAQARHIEIRGRADDKDSSTYNEYLALRRAQEAADYLVAHGVPVTKISVNYQPEEHTHDDATTDHVRNRRVDIEVFN